MNTRPCIGCDSHDTRLWLVPESQRHTWPDEIVAYCQLCEPFEGQPINEQGAA